MHASGCGDDFTYRFFLDYTGDIVDDPNALWTTSATA